MVLVQRWPFFQTFFIREYRPGKCLLRYSRTKRAFLDYKNKKFKKARNWHCPRRLTHGLVQKWPFFQLFFLFNIGLENVFYGILEPTNTFLGYKIKSSKSRKIDLFPNGLTHGFGAKMAIFPTFFLKQHKTGKCLLRYSRTKKRLSSL